MKFVCAPYADDGGAETAHLFRYRNKIESKIPDARVAIGSRYGKSPFRSRSENSRNASHHFRSRAWNLQLLHPCFRYNGSNDDVSLLRWRPGSTCSESSSAPIPYAGTESSGAVDNRGRHPGKEGGP